MLPASFRSFLLLEEAVNATRRLIRVILRVSDERCRTEKPLQMEPRLFGFG